VTGEFDAFMLGWLGNIDPDDFYYAQHHSEGINNFQGFADDEVDQLLDDARVEIDDDARKELYDQAAERIVDLASYIYFYNPDIVQAWSPRSPDTRPARTRRRGSCPRASNGDGRRRGDAGSRGERDPAALRQGGRRVGQVRGEARRAGAARAARGVDRRLRADPPGAG
jgi:hypothetical protein